MDDPEALEFCYAKTIWPDLAKIGEKRKDWTLKWQEIMS